MKVAIIGSRGLTVDDLNDYLPEGVTEIVSGGARGIDTCARQYALSAKIKLTEFRPDYERYGRAAPLKRNDQIVDYADHIVAIWDGASRGTKYTIERCQRRGKTLTVFTLKGEPNDEKLDLL